MLNKKKRTLKYFNMKKLIIVMMLIVISANAQKNHFGTNVPDRFASVSLRVDPLGSYDKEGINTMFSIQAVAEIEDILWELELQSQSILTDKYSRDNNMQFDYLDLQVGLGIMIPVGDRIALTGGFHSGLMWRFTNTDRPTNEGYWIIGFTGKIRYWVGNKKRVAFVLGSTYDLRNDIGEWKINTSGGIEVRLN